jgi:ADP-heptose:LPS heptosyltransferase
VIGFAVKERYAALVGGNPAVARIHTLRDGSPGNVLELCREIRRERYGTVIDLHGNARSALLATCAGARAITRYVKRDPGDALRVRLRRAPYRARRRLVERYLESLAPLGIEHAYRRPRFHPDAGSIASAGAYLRESGLEPGGYAAIVPGSKWPTKTWPAEGYGEVARALASEDGLPVLVLGSAAERGLADEVARRVPGARSAAGAVSLGEAACLLSSARLAIGNDTGPTHIAMACGTPTVAIFGPTDPAQFDFEGHELIYADLPCSACSFFGSRRCRLGHWRCMRAIPPVTVLAAARRLLSGGGPPA